MVLAHTLHTFSQLYMPEHNLIRVFIGIEGREHRCSLSPQ
jgi:hypothetical protein